MESRIGHRRACIRAAALIAWSLARAAAPGDAAAQERPNVYGTVRTAEGRPVAAAFVVLRAPAGKHVGTEFTDEGGRFSLGPVPPGQYVLTVSSIGYSTAVESVEVLAGELARVDVVLVPEAVQVQPLRADLAAARRAALREEAGITAHQLTQPELKLIPGLAEPDPMRAVATLPGVVSSSDVTSSFNVRGASADQNLILLDGIPVFSPQHLGGVFSIFNTDIIDRAELYSGGFPPEFGGRVSSVLSIESDVGDGDFGVSGGLSLLAGRVAVGGGLESGLGFRDLRWRFSVRRSHLDRLLRPAMEFPYHLTDAQGVVEAWAPGGDRVLLTGYWGRDVLDFRDSEPSEFPLRFYWDWGNALGGLRWTRPRSGGGTLDARAGISTFDTRLRFIDYDDPDLRSEIRQALLTLDLEQPLSSTWTLKSGIEANALEHHNRILVGGTEFSASAGRAWLASGYAQLSWRAWDRWSVEGGIRVDAFRPDDGAESIEVAPRLSVKRFIAGEVAAVKLSVGRYTQYLHSVRDEELPLGLDTWVVAGAHVPYVVSDQAQLGFELRPASGWFVSTEVYERRFEGVVTTNPGEDPNDPGDDLLPGNGLSRGADLMIRRAHGRTRGWLSVSWLKATRTFPDFTSSRQPLPEITYPPSFDRRLDVNVVVQRDLPGGIEGGLRWHFGTGTPYTRPVAGHALYATRFSLGARRRWQGPSSPEDSGGFGVVMGRRNAERYPDYHRLDLSFRRPMDLSWGRVVPYLDILNVYNRKNVLIYFYEFDRDVPIRSGLSMFPLLPALGVEVRF